MSRSPGPAPHALARVAGALALLLVGPALALWLPFGVFATCSVWLFWVADRRPGQDPLAHLFDGIGNIAGYFQRRLPRRLRKAAE